MVFSERLISPAQLQRNLIKRKERMKITCLHNSKKYFVYLEKADPWEKLTGILGNVGFEPYRGS